MPYDPNTGEWTPGPKGKPGIPNAWDDYLYEPYNPNDPETPPGGGQTGACPAGTQPETVGADGNWRTAAPGECIDSGEWNRRVDLNIRNNPGPNQSGGNGGSTSASAPKPSGPVPPYNPGYQFKPVPQFEGIPDFQGPTFNAPSFEDAMNDPGYRFAVDEGRRARDASAAARGTLRTGAQARSLDAYGQNMGAQQYSNVYGRRFGEHVQDYGQKWGEYGQRYRQALDQYSPKLAEWSLLSNAEIGGKNIANQNQWGQYWGNNLTAAQLLQLLQGL